MASELTLSSTAGLLRFVDEQAYSPGSADNATRYATEIDLAGDYRASSILGFWVGDHPALRLAAGGGATKVHPHTAVIVDDRVFIAVGDQAVCVSLDTLEVAWARQADYATCFGLWFCAARSALISRGELEVSRLSPDGDIVWAAGGRDIFTGAFNLAPGWVEATDWDGRVYRFDYETGAEVRAS